MFTDRILNEFLPISVKEDAPSTMVKGLDVSCRPFNRSSYIDIAQYIIKLWNDGYWKDVQKKYSPAKF